jgi:hypothetical protein
MLTIYYGGINTLCINLQRTFRGFAMICGATAAFGGASALTNVASAQTLAAPAPAPAAPAAAPVSTATPWTYQGLFDMYYLYDGNASKGVGTSPITGFEYDERASTPTLSLAELNIAKAAPANGGIGFKATLIAGDTADINDGGFGSTSEESRTKNLEQLYVTFAAKSGAGFDIGKFYTPFGYEVTESNANYNYSRSFIFTDLLPVYHTGIRLYTQSYKGLVLTGYVVKELNNSVYTEATGTDSEGTVTPTAVIATPVGLHSPSSSPAYIGNVNYAAPSGKYTAIESFGYGDDNASENSAVGDGSIAFGVRQKTTLSDTDVTITPDPVDTFGLNYTYRKDSIGDSVGVNPPDGHEDGYAGYYRRQLSTPYAVAFRAEYLDGKNSDYSVHADSLTATLEDKTTKSLLLRLEFRHDDTHIPSDDSGDPTVIQVGPFADSTGSLTKDTQNTLSLSAVYAFGP